MAQAHVICHWCNFRAVCATPTTLGAYKPACREHKSGGSVSLDAYAAINARNSKT